MGILKETIQDLGSPAILVGNGINLTSKILDDWGGLLNSIGGNNIKSDGLTNTEIYDFIDLKRRNFDCKQAIIERVVPTFTYASLHFLCENCN